MFVYIYIHTYVYIYIYCVCIYIYIYMLYKLYIYIYIYHLYSCTSICIYEVRRRRGKTACEIISLVAPSKYPNVNSVKEACSLHVQSVAGAAGPARARPQVREGGPVRPELILLIIIIIILTLIRCACI